MNERIGGSEIRELRLRLGMTEVEFALLFGVTVRTVELWEADVVVPSLLTSMVIRAEAEKRLAAPPAASAAKPATAAAPRARRSRTQRQVAAPRPAARPSRRRA